MKIYKLEDMIKGWFIGNFSPSVLQTEQFEVGVLKRKKGLERPMHYHKEAVEISCLLLGKANINGQEINPGDIFVLYPFEKVDALYYEDSTLLVVKTPSVLGDKYEV